MKESVFDLLNYIFSLEFMLLGVFANTSAHTFMLTCHKLRGKI